MWTTIAAIAYLFGVVLADVECPSKQTEPWSYGGSNGPENWGNNFPQCNGMNQSPIEINRSDIRPDNDDENALTTFGYDKPVSAILENNGHAVYVRPNDGVSRGIRIGSQTYTLVQGHFHFGKNDNEGSEHTIAGEGGYVMEFHLVHQNGNGELAVVGILFKVMGYDNLSLLTVTKNLKSIRYENESTTIHGLKLEKLFPYCDDPVYFTYQGSLTTPPCSEGVTWFVVNGASYVSNSQMTDFRKLFETKRGEEECKLAGNFRTPQPLNRRTVTGYYGSCIV